MTALKSFFGVGRCKSTTEDCDDKVGVCLAGSKALIDDACVGTSASKTDDLADGNESDLARFGAGWVSEGPWRSRLTDTGSADGAGLRLARLTHGLCAKLSRACSFRSAPKGGGS